MAMGWARTLRLAHLLTQAIQAHVAAQPSPPPQDGILESIMDDTAPLPATDSTQAAAPAAPAAPAPSDAAQTGLIGGIETKLDRVIDLVKILNDNPAIHSLLCALLGIEQNKPAA